MLLSKRQQGQFKLLWCGSSQLWVCGPLLPWSQAAALLVPVNPGPLWPCLTLSRNSGDSVRISQVIYMALIGLHTFRLAKCEGIVKQKPALFLEQDLVIHKSHFVFWILSFRHPSLPDQVLLCFDWPRTHSVNSFCSLAGVEVMVSLSVSASGVLRLPDGSTTPSSNITFEMTSFF